MLSKEVSSPILKVFGMTRPGIEPRTPGPLANTLPTDAPIQAETLLHSLERATAGIGLHVNAHKTEYMCFNQKGDISTLNGSTLKIVDNFNNLGSSVSSNETDINLRLAKALAEVRPDR